MNQHRFDTVVQLIVGLVALVIMVLWVHQGALTANDAMSVVGVVLAAFGFGEVGRRQEKKKNR